MGEQKPGHSKRTEFLNGAKATIPLEIGAAPFGIIFGALAVTAGLSRCYIVPLCERLAPTLAPASRFLAD